MDEEIERLEALNSRACERRKQLYHKSSKSLLQLAEIYGLSHMNTRFDVVLEVLRVQSERIRNLEAIISKLTQEH